jgi:hypothetical protein
MTQTQEDLVNDDGSVVRIITINMSADEYQADCDRIERQVATAQKTVDDLTPIQLQQKGTLTTIKNKINHVQQVQI